MASKVGNWGFYHRLRPTQIDAVRDQRPIAYIPWGALEWHSYHNPIGLDGFIAETLCVALAEAEGGVVLPPVYIGTDTIKVAHNFAHSIEHASSTVQTLCTEFCRQLSEERFRVIVIVTGHCGGGHREALEASIETCRTELKGTGIILIPAFDPVQDDWPVNHAAEGETSLQLVTDDSLVDLQALPLDRVTDLETDGVWGNDPRTATIDKGKDIVDLFVSRCRPLVQEALQKVGAT